MKPKDISQLINEFISELIHEQTMKNSKNQQALKLSSTKLTASPKKQILKPLRPKKTTSPKKQTLKPVNPKSQETLKVRSKGKAFGIPARTDGYVSFYKGLDSVYNSF